MADEEPQHETNEEPPTDCEGERPNDADSDVDQGADDTATDTSVGPEEPQAPRGAFGQHSAGNAWVMGTLTLHGRERDVHTVLDGASALKMLSIFQQRGSGDSPLADRLNAFTSTARNAWLVADLDELIAVSWWPGLPHKTPRTAIDPVVDAA